VAGQKIGWEDRQLDPVEEVYYAEHRQVRPPAADNDEGKKRYVGMPDIKYGQVMRAALSECVRLRGYWCSRDFVYAKKVINREANEDRVQALAAARKIQRQEAKVAGKRSVPVTNKEVRAMVPDDEVGKIIAEKMAQASMAVVKENLAKNVPLADQPGLTKKEVRAVLLNNFREFCLKCKIEGKDGKMLQFVWNRPQRQLAKMLAVRLVTGKPVLGVIAKARKWGCSLLVVHWMAWMMLRSPNTRIMLVLHHKDYLGEFRRRYKQVFMSLPSYIAPKIITDNASQLCLENGSLVDFYTAGTKQTADSVGRSTGYQWAHFTEVPFWHAPDRTFTAALSSVYLGPNTGVVVESTPQGAYGKFYDMYNEAKQGLSDYFPYYVPWHIVDDYKLLPTLDQRDNWQKWRETGDDKYRIAMGVTSTGKPIVLEDHENRIGRFGLSCDQYLWWCDTFRNRHAGNLLSMKQEYGDDDVSCFLTAAKLAFEQEEIAYLKQICDALRDNLYDCGLVYDANGVIQLDRASRVYKIHEAPSQEVIAESRYLAVMDTSFGGSAQADWSVMKVYRREMDSFVLCAKIKSKLQPSPFCDLCERLLSWYGQPLLAIEANKGEAHINEFRNRNYPRLLRRPRINVIDGSKLEDAIGFWMSESARAVCLATLDRYIRDGRLIDPDDDLYSEMFTFVVNETTGKKEAAKNCNDDHVICTAIACHLDDAYPLTAGERRPVQTQASRQAALQAAEYDKAERDFSSVVQRIPAPRPFAPFATDQGALPDGSSMYWANDVRLYDND
jgi:hypothetical protein